MDTEPKKNVTAKSYPCDTCPAKSDRNCSVCLFARWNVEGVMNAFNRKRLQGDFSNSPLIQRAAESPQAQATRMLQEMDRAIHPKLGKLIIPSYNRMAELTQQMNKR